MKWCLYILKSEKYGKIYIGSTCDIQRRLADHNRGNTTSTRRFTPWFVAYTREISNKERSTSQRKANKKLEE